MKIIKAKEKDFKEINELIEREFSYTTKGMPAIKQRIKQGNLVFIARNKNVFFGFIEFKLNEFTASLFGISVKKEFRKKGIGKKLLNFFVDYCKKKGTKKISLIVKKNNFKAKNLYKSKGFIKAQELNKKIDGSTIEKMELTLEEYLGVS
jgi:ribosomal-protein-alanine N-acetyltransferase